MHHRNRDTFRMKNTLFSLTHAQLQCFPSNNCILAQISPESQHLYQAEELRIWHGHILKQASGENMAFDPQEQTFDHPQLHSVGIPTSWGTK